jgi:predicted RND superfamily exporter protein
VGITQIKLKTGNDTLISDSSTIYQNNEAYQSEFGKDPIILIFDQETTFDQQTLTLMHLVQEDIDDLEGVFAINSPVTMINQISANLYDQTETGLEQI